MNTPIKNKIADCQNRLWLAAMNGKPTAALYAELDSLIARLNRGPDGKPEPLTLIINTQH